MRLTTKGRLRSAMIDLALRQSSGPVTLAAISQRQQISRCRTLSSCSVSCAVTTWSNRRAALAAAIRWRARLPKLPWPTSSCPVDEQLGTTSCGGKSNCQGDDHGPCMTHDLWTSLNARMLEFLRSVTLQKLVDDQVAKGVRVEDPMIKRAISSVPVLKPVRVNAPNSTYLRWAPPRFPNKDNRLATP